MHRSGRRLAKKASSFVTLVFQSVMSDMNDMNVFILMLLDYQVCLSAIVLPNRCSFHFQYELILLSKLLASSSNTWQGFEGVFFLQSFENLKEFEFGLGNLSHSLEQCLDAMTAISHVHIITSLAWQIREVPIFLALTSKGMEAAFYSRRSTLFRITFLTQ